MTDIGEAVAVAAITKEDDEPCWYCKEELAEIVDNEEDEGPESTGTNSDAIGKIPENKEDNNASKLGKNLISNGYSVPQWKVKHPDTKKHPNLNTDIVAAAHHCIPGGASLAHANDLHKFMRKDGPYSLSSDIGYNVNHANNGVWLPGNYAVRGSNNPPFDKNWSGYSTVFKNKYALDGMEKAHGRQFHDAHRKYNGKVKKTLISIASKLVAPDDKCPICNEKFDKSRPPFGLVGRLDLVSSEHKTMLTNPKKEEVSQGYYTSSRVKKKFNIV